jgi:hypothetical protein
MSLLPAFGCDKRHNGDRTGPFDGDRQFSLMFGTVSCDSTRHDLATFRNEIVENDRIFIVDFDIGVRTESTEFLSVKKFFLGRTGWFFAVGYCHDYSPFVVLSSLMICFLPVGFPDFTS